MSVNRQRPHVLVLPEDDANRQIANGFVQEIDHDKTRQTQILPSAGGWKAVLDTFERDHIAGMDEYPNRSMVLLIDFDGKLSRLALAKARIPDRVKSRVFIVGAKTQPEALKVPFGTFERTGLALAEDCRHQRSNHWSHDLLSNNEEELKRLIQAVRPILFS